jgi:hypothetical protein
VNLKKSVWSRIKAATILQIQLKINSGVLIGVILGRLVVEMTSALMMRSLTLPYTS